MPISKGNPFFILVLCLLTTQVQAQITVGEVINRIQENVTCGWNKETVDNLKSGQLDQKVTGIATTFMATLEVLKRAKAQNINFIITHEPTFYNHFDDKKALENDPVQQAKLKFIEENDIAIFRFHDHMHRTDPDIIEVGLVKRLGWKKYQEGEAMIFNLPEMTVKKLAKKLEQEFDNKAVRVVGEAKMKVDRVGIVPGAYGSYTQIEMLNQGGIDAIIVGETREWETVEYTRDAVEVGFQKALIVMGHADSEEDGMEYCKDWLKVFISEVPIQFIPAGNPLWSP